ncbi:MAG TPA: RDD family protein [Trebonia sp.]|nr:RDD family protein [Trebonia sp.]
MGRRVLALIADWVLCEVIVAAVTRHEIFASTMDSRYFATMDWTLLVFALEVWLLTGINGVTIGKRLLGIRVIATDGSRPGFGWALLRTILLLFVVPPLLSDRDLRGLHDRAANTIVVRM